MKQMGDSIRVLLVDDDPLADATATSLERTDESMTVFVATTPTEALDRLGRATRAESVDCVVSDYDLPEMDGLTLFDEVRAVDSALPFVLFTGKGSEEIASEAISAGVTDYLRKESGADQSEVLANSVENAVAQYRAEREAEAATREVDRLLERITDAFFALDDDWRFRYVNERAASFFERSVEELVGEDIREAFAIGHADEFHDAYGRAMETQEPTTVESESVLKPGTWLEAQAYPAPDGLSVYFRDVTERKRMENELRATKRKIEALYDVAARAVSCTTAAEIYDLALEAAEEILEFDFCAVDAVEGDELRKHAVSHRIPDDGYYETVPVDSDGSLAAAAYRSGESRLVRDLHAEGFTPAESDYRSALTVPIGEFGVFQAVSEERGGFDDEERELTELLVAHLIEALRRIDSETQLRAERDRFVALFENVPNAVASCVYEDGQPIVRAVNPAFEETFGWSGEELVGEPLDDYVVPDDRRGGADALNERALRGEHVEGTEVRRATVDGLRDFLLNTAPVRETEGGEGSDPGRDETEDVSVYTEITEQKERQRELARQNERLDEFASVVSHDLRNPLNVAQGRVALLDGECDSDHLDPIAVALDRMDALVEDLLALARQDDPVDEAGTESVDLRALAADAWTTVETGDATLRIEDDVTLAGASGRVRQLLENLFHNAVEHVGSDVCVRVGSLGDTEGFYVADDGPGIPESERDRVFEHGFTTADQGTGFGLSIVADVAEAHGWNVAVEESAEGGVRFEIRA